MDIVIPYVAKKALSWLFCLNLNYFPCKPISLLNHLIFLIIFSHEFYYNSLNNSGWRRVKSNGNVPYK